GGATVTFDGGESWSSIYNQPTAQFYRVNADNLTPYTVYGGQQDNSTIAITSDDFDGDIGPDNYSTVGGGESAHIAFDVDNPRLIYATTINSTLTEFDAELERTRLIKPYPEYVFGRNVADQKYRFNWNAPVIVSPHDPSTIYYGSQFLLKSTDRGLNWEEISPDLTKNDKSKQGLGGGPITNEQAGAEFYNTIFYIVESKHEEGAIWVGSDDGLVHITRNGGESWDNVTPRGVDEAHINAIEVSPHDPGTAYLAVTGYKLNDYTPYIYVTRNYGNSWRRIDRGLPEDAFVRVVREDPVRPGVLYAGTESGAFVSFDNGADRWKSLDLNLPPVPITDMIVRQNDLIAATQGRGFWILDDLHILQQTTASIASTSLHLFTPETAIRQAGGSGSAGTGDPVAPAKPRGAHFTYFIGDDLDLDGSDFSIEILDAAGALVRSYSNKETPHDVCAEGNSDPRNPLTVSRPSPSAGLNSWTWNLERDPLHCTPGVKIFAGLDGPRVIPGDYRVRISAGGEQAEQSFEVIADPRAPAEPAQYAELGDYLARSAALLDALLVDVDVAKQARTQIQAQMDIAAGGPNETRLTTLGEAAIERLDAWIALVTQPKHETFEDDINWPNMLDVQIRHLIDAIDRADAPVTAGGKLRYTDLEAEWGDRNAELDAISATEIAAFNSALSDLGIAHIPTP
ncbi:MAG: glycosyl hydrolase, partial [Pseudomonadota bacterium]